MLKFEYTRNLPHFQRIGRCFFITFNLKGALPADVVRQLQRERDAELLNLKGNLSANPLDAVQRIRKRYLVKIDTILDSCRFGPKWLTQPLVGDTLMNELHLLDGVNCTLIAACVMANHVHLITDLAIQLDRLKPEEYPDDTNYMQLYQILQRFKGRTAFQANQLLHRQGTFWQSESFDHYIRNETSLERFISYVLNNPVNAGLVDHWQNWPFHYVHPDFAPQL